jgi:hypothetical protein
VVEHVKPLPLRPRRGSCYPEDTDLPLDWVTARDSGSWRAVADAFGSAPFRAVRPIGRYWDSVTNLFSYRPTSPRYRERLGPAHHLEISLGRRDSPSEPWMLVEATARGAYDRRDAGDGHYTQVLTHDHPPEHKARAKLADAVSVPIDFSRLLLAAERDRPHVLRAEIERRIEAAPTEEVKAAPTEEVSVPVDGVSVAFTVVRFAGFAAASATLPDRTITAWGRFDCRDLRLRSISEITPWSSAADDSQQR